MGWNEEQDGQNEALAREAVPETTNHNRTIKAKKPHSTNPRKRTSAMGPGDKNG